VKILTGPQRTQVLVSAPTAVEMLFESKGARASSPAAVSVESTVIKTSRKNFCSGAAQVVQRATLPPKRLLSVGPKPGKS